MILETHNTSSYSLGGNIPMVDFTHIIAYLFQ